MTDAATTDLLTRAAAASDGDVRRLVQSVLAFQREVAQRQDAIDTLRSRASDATDRAKSLRAITDSVLASSSRAHAFALQAAGQRFNDQAAAEQNRVAELQRLQAAALADLERRLP
jgi:CII-binding regulator of phage lambda lysogenization HflD